MSDTNSSKCRSELAFANLILRLWVGLRLLMAGVDKFRPKGTNEYHLGDLEVLKKNVQPIYENMVASTFMPASMVASYVFVLSYSLIVVGILVIVGIFSRLSLLVAGLLFVSLSFGLMALPDDDQAVYRGIEVAITALALATAAHGKISVDGFFGLLFRRRSAPVVKAQ